MHKKAEGRGVKELESDCLRAGGGVEEEKEEEGEVNQIKCFSEVTRWDNARRSLFHGRFA